MIKENKNKGPKKGKSNSLRTNIKKIMKIIKERDIARKINIVGICFMLVVVAIMFIDVSLQSLKKPGPQSYRRYSNEELDRCNFTVVLTFETKNPEFFATDFVQVDIVVDVERLPRRLGDGNYTIETEFMGSALLKKEHRTYPPVSSIKLFSNPDSERFIWSDNVTIVYDAPGVYPIRVELCNASEIIDSYIIENAFPVQSISLKYQIEAIDMQYRISMTLLIITFIILIATLLQITDSPEKH